MILPPSLTRIFRNLEEVGLIKRAIYKQDQRKVLINLTAKGRKKYRQIVPESERIYRSIEKTIGKKELDELLKRLIYLNQSLENE